MFWVGFFFWTVHEEEGSKGKFKKKCLWINYTRAFSKSQLSSVWCHVTTLHTTTDSPEKKRPVSPVRLKHTSSVKPLQVYRKHISEMYKVDFRLLYETVSKICFWNKWWACRQWACKHQPMDEIPHRYDSAIKFLSLRKNTERLPAFNIATVTVWKQDGTWFEI